jgi:hypothetical protein
MDELSLDNPNILEVMVECRLCHHLTKLGDCLCPPTKDEVLCPVPDCGGTMQERRKT